MTAEFDHIREGLRTRPARRVQEPDAREAAVALILVPALTAGLELLLIERAKRVGDPWSGQMALPGGRREGGDDRLLETARRETQEETGVELAPESLLGELDDLFPNIAVLPKVVVRPFVFGLEQRPAVRGSEEVAAHLWSSLETLRAERHKADVTLAEGRRTVDAFILGERIVWGITYRIVSALLDVVR